MTDKDYYKILGVEHDASIDDIRKAFQSKARKLHPDVNKEADAEERFKEVSEAYAVLSDADKRARYDAMRSASPFSYSNQSSSYGQGTYSGGYTNDPFADWGWPFSSMGGWSTSRYRSTSRGFNPHAGGDIEYELELDAKAAAQGVRRGVSFQRYERCSACNGVGSVHSEHAQTCPSCSGTGRISLDLSSFMGFGVMEMVCPECEGSGKVVVDPCAVCGGTGRVVSAGELVIDVPEDSHDGDEIRIAGMGNAGTNGEATGDFVCRVGISAERLQPVQHMGFRIVGFILPYFAMAVFFTRSLSGPSLFVYLFLAYGLYSAFSAGISHPKRWWEHAGEALLRGIAQGLPLAIVMFLLYSCTIGLGAL